MYSTLLRPVIGSLHRAYQDFFLYILNSLHLLNSPSVPHPQPLPAHATAFLPSTARKSLLISMLYLCVPVYFPLCSLFPLKKQPLTPSSLLQVIAFHSYYV